MTTLASTRDARPDVLHHESRRTLVAGFFGSRLPAATRGSRWVAVVYVVVALAAPLLLYAGPQVMSPAAPVIVEKALHSEMALRLRMPKAAAK